MRKDLIIDKNDQLEAINNVNEEIKDDIKDEEIFGKRLTRADSPFHVTILCFAAGLTNAILRRTSPPPSPATFSKGNCQQSRPSRFFFSFLLQRLWVCNKNIFSYIVIDAPLPSRRVYCHRVVN